MVYKIPACVGNRNVFIKCDVVNAPIPLLFSKEAMKKAGVKLDFVNDRMIFLGQTVNLQDMGIGHYGVYIRPKGEVAMLLEECLLTVEDNNSRKLFPEDLKRERKVNEKVTFAVWPLSQEDHDKITEASECLV